MKKKIVYTGLVLFFFVATAFVVIRYNTKIQGKVTGFYPLKERKGSLANSAEWTSVKEKGNKLIRIVRETPDDLKSTLALATIYIQEGRATGDYSYYNAAASKYIDDVLSVEPKNLEALILKSVVQLSQHHFAEGLQTAEKAKAINPYNAYVYGLITDGNVEMGNYQAAIENLDKMVSIRPDLRSYSRIAYIREIHGQNKAAIEAMKMAVDAGYPGEESTEWARVQLAQLYEKAGDLKNAEMHYASSLNVRPGYAYAIAGLGNIALAKNDYAKAINQYKQADSLINDYSIKEKLIQAYLLSNQKQNANGLISAMREELNKAAAEGESGANHHADDELASVYLLEGNYPMALKHALAEYNRRPNNIDVAEMAAWAHYKNSEAEKALPYLEKALRTGSKNPTLLCRAGIIYAQLGERVKAKALLQDALKDNPVIDPLLKNESMALFKRL
jgi:tetratricopeptide (TPR) repeat protein